MGYIPAAWSLPAEMQFYLLLPLLALVFSRRPVLLPFTILAACVGQMVLIKASPPALKDLVASNWPYMALPFICGMAAAWLVVNRKPGRTFIWAAPGLLLLMLFIPTRMTFAREFLLQVHYPWRYLIDVRGLVPSVFFALIIVGMTGTNTFERMLSWRPLRAVGIAGYSIFLLHISVYWLVWPMMQHKVLWFIGPCLAIPAGLLSYMFVEVPSIHLGQKLGASLFSRKKSTTASSHPQIASASKEPSSPS